MRVGVKTALRKTGFTKSLKDPPAPYTATRESLKVCPVVVCIACPVPSLAVRGRIASCIVLPAPL